MRGVILVRYRRSYRVSSLFTTRMYSMRSFKWAIGAMGVLLFVATLSAQGQGQQGQGGQAAPPQGGQAPARGQGGAPAGRQGGGGGGGRGFTNLMVLPRDMP